MLFQNVLQIKKCSQYRSSGQPKIRFSKINLVFLENKTSNKEFRHNLTAANCLVGIHLWDFICIELLYELSFQFERFCEKSCISIPYFFNQLHLMWNLKFFQFTCNRVISHHFLHLNLDTPTFQSKVLNMFCDGSNKLFIFNQFIPVLLINPQLVR